MVAQSAQKARVSATIVACLAVVVFSIPAGAAAPDSPGQPTLADVLRELRALQAKVRRQEQEIQHLKMLLYKQQSAQAAPSPIRAGSPAGEVRGTTPPPKPAVQTPAIALRDNIDRLTLQGDIFFRYETRTADTGSPTNPEENRDRLRTRLRLGAVWKDTADKWEIGAGLATGTVVGHGCTDTWSEKEIFESGDIRLDYAYARHNWDHLALIIGQQKNPFYTTQLVWDVDYRPVGFTLRANYQPFFATLGYYDVLWGPNLKKDKDDADVKLCAAQIGASIDLGPSTRLLAAAATYIFSDNFNEAAPRSGYDPYKYSPGLYAVGDDYHVHLADLFLRLDTRTGPLKWKAYAQVTTNLGAAGNVSQQLSPAGIDPEDNDLAWLVGFDVKYRKFMLRYWYNRIEADSVFGPLKFDTYGAGAGLTDTNIQGHYAGIFYWVTPHLSLAIKAMIIDQIIGGRDADLWQFDIKYLF